MSIPFITYTIESGFQLTPQANSFLCSISQTPIAVLSIVGNYRTGKSFFINRVILNKQNGNGFTVGPSINPCTKGLWIWSQPLEHQNPNVSKDVKVLLLDSEGFGGMDQNLSHNSKIGLFSLILSSYFIYNSLGIIDENSLNTLSLIVSLGQELLKKEENSNIFPSFLWILRDFALQLITNEGKTISNQQYLEKALEITEKMTENKARIRKAILKIFNERDCMTFVRPVAHENDLQRLDSLENKLLRPEFIEQTVNARQKIFSSIKPKKINGKVLTAGMFLEMVKSFIPVINGEKVPDIKSTWVYLCKNQMNNTFSSCISYAEIEYDKLKSLDLNSGEIKKFLKKIKQEIKQKMKKNLLGICEKQEKKELFQKIQKFLDSQNQEITRLMEEKNKKKNAAFLEDKLISFKNHIDLSPENYLSEYKALQDFFKENNIFDEEYLSFHQNVFKICLENYSNKIIHMKKTMSKLNEQKISILEKDIQNKKQEFLSEKERFEKKISDLEIQIATLKREKEKIKNNKKTIASQTLNSFPDENLSNFKKEFEKKILSLIQEKNELIEKMNHLIAEKAEAFDKITCLQREINEIKEMHSVENNLNNKEDNGKFFLNAKKISDERKKERYTEQEGELIQITNRALTITLEKSEEEAKNLKEKLSKLKEYKLIFKNTLQFQCQICQKFISQAHYWDHATAKTCSKEKDLVNIYSSLNEVPNNRSLNISTIISPKPNNPNISTESESHLVCEEILNPIEENRQISFKRHENLKTTSELNNSKPSEKKENLEELIERLSRNEKYSILQAKKREMLSPKGPFTNLSQNKSTLKKEQKKSNECGLNSNRMLTLNWDNTENENPCSQRFDSMNFLFKSMRNCEIIARKNEEKNSMFFKAKNWNQSGFK